MKINTLALKHLSGTGISIITLKDENSYGCEISNLSLLPILRCTFFFLKLKWKTHHALNIFYTFEYRYNMDLYCPIMPTAVAWKNVEYRSNLVLVNKKGSVVSTHATTERAVGSRYFRRIWSEIDRDEIDGLVQERRNSIAIALDLRLSCTNPSKWDSTV